MFGRGNNAKVESEKDGPGHPGQKPEEKQSKAAGGSTIPVVPMLPASDERTIIGEGVVIEGNLSGAGNIRIEGQVKGNVEVQGDSVTIGRQGRVEGEVTARNARVSGRMDGKIAALESVNITSSADFYGEIKAGQISIDDGAFFKGKIQLDREPNRKGVPAGKTKGKSNDKPYPKTE